MHVAVEIREQKKAPEKEKKVGRCVKVTSRVLQNGGGRGLFTIFKSRSRGSIFKTMDVKQPVC